MEAVPENDKNNEFTMDHQVIKTLIINTITRKCASSPHEALKQMNHAINLSRDGSKLKAKLISEGFTNHVYKVFVDTHPELSLSAKLCFETGQYKLQRTENEYKIMNTVSTKTSGECVATPIACWDVNHEGQDMKLLLVEWSNEDEQFLNQFMDGCVDSRIAPQLANTLAALHNIRDFDPASFNGTVKPSMEGFLSHMKMVAFIACQSDTPVRRTDAYLTSLGGDVVLGIMDAVITDYYKRDTLIHSEAHPFNILVEAKPSIEKLEQFGPNGTVVIDDWEMAMAGPIGKDLGLGLAYPIGCMIAHTLNGHNDEANPSIEAYINTLIDTYCSRMVEAGKTPEEVGGIMRNIIGWTGWFQFFTFFILGDVFPFPVESEASKTRLRDALGVLGFKLLRVSYDTNHVSRSASAEDIRKIFNDLRGEEVKRAQDVFAAGKLRRQPRKSSIWRSVIRRVSGTEMFYAAAEASLSNASTEITESIRRLSVSGEIGDSMKFIAIDLHRLSAISVSTRSFMKSITEDIKGTIEEDNTEAAQCKTNLEDTGTKGHAKEGGGRKVLAKLRTAGKLFKSFSFSS